MRTIIYSLFLGVFLAVTSPVYAEGERWIKVTSPNGGESFKEGDAVTITWDSSPNIDKVSIGYSFGPGSLNWIAFTAPNTKSYTWKVDVGNTTRTQILIDITGWETGHGSTNDKSDNYFTVIQKNEYPDNPPNNPTPTPTSNIYYRSNSSGSYAPIVIVLPTPTPKPTPRPVVLLSVTNISWWNFFFFEGSKTTDIKSLANPSKVENFTLDTPLGYTFTFNETLNMTNQTTLKAFQDLKKYWVIETTEVWLKAEWWTTYKLKTPVTVTYAKPELTGAAPKIVTDTKVTAKPPVVKTSTKGKTEITVENGAKFTIKPQVIVTDPDQIAATSPSHTFNGTTSHSNLIYSVKVNGMPVSAASPIVNADTGSFQITVDKLSEGANFVQISAGTATDSTQLIAERTVWYKPNWWNQTWTLIVNWAGKYFHFMTIYILPLVK